MSFIFLVIYGNCCSIHVFVSYLLIPSISTFTCIKQFVSFFFAVVYISRITGFTRNKIRNRENTLFGLYISLLCDSFSFMI